MKSATSKIILVVALVAAAYLAFQFIGSVPPSTPAAYIKDVAAYKEGMDGFVVYFTLADSTGALTASDGAAKLYFKPEDDQKYTILDKAVDRNDFRRATVGIGAFARDSLIYSFGRIETKSLWFLKDNHKSGKIVINFITPQGRVLSGEEYMSF